MTRDEYVASLKSTFLAVGVKQVMEFLISKSAFFGLSFINPIMAYIVSKVVTILIEKTDVAIFFLYIDMRVGEQAKNYETAALNNHYAQIGTDEELKKKTEADLIRTFTEFATFAR